MRIDYLIVGMIVVIITTIAFIRKRENVETVFSIACCYAGAYWAISNRNAALALLFSFVMLYCCELYCEIERNIGQGKPYGTLLYRE